MLLSSLRFRILRFREEHVSVHTYTLTREKEVQTTAFYKVFSVFIQTFSCTQLRESLSRMVYHLASQ